MPTSKKTVAIKLCLFALCFLTIYEALAFITIPAKSITRVVMHDFYKQNNLDFVLLGGSRVYRGVIPDIMEQRLGMNGFGLSSGSQSMVDSYFLLEEVYRLHSPKLLIIDVNWKRFQAKDLVGATLTYVNFEPSLNKLAYLINGFTPDQYIKGFFPGLQYYRNLFTALIKNPMEKLSSDYRSYVYDDPVVGRYEGKGFTRSFRSIPVGNMGKPKVTPWEPESIDSESLLYFDKILRLCKENDTRVFCFIPPVPPATLKEYGNYSECAAYVQDLMSSYGTELYNFNLLRPDLFVAKEEYFFDEVHMNGAGAETFTPVFSDFIADYMDGSLNVSDYLLDSYEKLLELSPRVLCAWLEDNRDAGVFTAFTYSGGDVSPEFQFQCKPAEGGSFITLLDYGGGAVLPYPSLPVGKYTIRVNARAKGSDAEFEQFYELAYIVE